MTAGELSDVVMVLGDFLLELSTRPGADPLLAQQINAMLFGPMGAAGATPPSATTPPAAVSTPASVVPATTESAGATTTPARAASSVPPMTASPATLASTSNDADAAPVTTQRAASPSASVASASAGDGWTTQTWLLLAIGGTGLFGIALYLVDRWRRSALPTPSGRPGFHELLDIGRRLAGSGSMMDVEEKAVRQAMRLVGAEAGAFVRHSERRLGVGFETDDGMLVADRLRDGVLDRVVGTGEELMQVSSTERSIRNLPASLLASPVFVGGSVAGAIVLVRGADRPFTDDDLRIITDLKSGVGAAFEQVQLNERTRVEARTDGLTGVSNRRALDLSMADHADRPFAAVMVDLDHFKSVNDTYGHQAGDELLRAVASRLVANVRPGDEVYRYGGEEFAIVLPHTDEAAAAEVAERVRIALDAAPFAIGPARTQHRATASMGVAAGVGSDAVFALADSSLYEAKAGGRNRVALASTSHTVA